MNPRRLLVVVAILAVAVVAWLPGGRSAWSATTQELFIASLVNPAKKNQSRTGIRASVAIAQAALETGWGRSSMSKDPINSLFSIKCTTTVSPYQSGCADVPSYEYTVDGVKYMATSSFRTYVTTGDSLLD